MLLFHAVSHPNVINGATKSSSSHHPSHGITPIPFNASMFPNPTASSSSTLHQLKLATNRSNTKHSPLAVAADAKRSFYTSDSFSQKQKLGAVVKPLEKPRIVLKFVWVKNNIGFALDQALPGYGTIPLSPYYFWPRKDAWEELKVFLENKRWISNKQMVILLNQAADIIDLWSERNASTMS